MSEIVVALDGDRPTEIPIVLVISPAKNSRGKPRAKVSFECGKAKRRLKIVVEVAENPPVARGPLSRRKVNAKRHASGNGS